WSQRLARDAREDRLPEGTAGGGLRGEGEDGHGPAPREGDGLVVAEHPPDRASGDPAETHRLRREAFGAAPGATAVRRRNRVHVYARTGRLVNAVSRERVVDEGEPRRGAAGRAVPSESRPDPVRPPPKRRRWDPSGLRPGDAVWGGGEHEVDDVALLAEATVLPDGVEATRAIDGAGGEHRRAQLEDLVEFDVRDADRRREAGAAVDGAHFDHL